MTLSLKLYHLTQIILQMWSCDQSLVTLAILREKLSWPQLYKDLTRKNPFFEGWSRFKFNNLGLALGTALKSFNSMAKGSKLKITQFWGLIPTFLEIAGEKLVDIFWWPPSPPPTLNQIATFLSSSFIVSKRFSVLESEINKFVWSDNIIRVSLLELLKKSFIYKRNKSGPRMEPCVIQKVILRYMLFSLLPSDKSYCWSFK